MSHVEAIMISRCEGWPEDCQGDENGCRHPGCPDLEPLEISHADFLRDFDRCPRQCGEGDQVGMFE